MTKQTAIAKAQELSNAHNRTQYVLRRGQSYRVDQELTQGWKLAELVKPTGQAGIDAGFAERVNPAKFRFSPQMVALVGAIIGHDYGARDGVRGGQLLAPISITSDGFVQTASTAHESGAFIGAVSDFERNIAAYKQELIEADLVRFEELYAINVKDWRL